MDTQPAPRLTADDIKKIKKLCGFHTMYVPRRWNSTTAILSLEGVSNPNIALERALTQAGFIVKTTPNKFGHNNIGFNTLITKGVKNVNHE